MFIYKIGIINGSNTGIIDNNADKLLLVYERIYWN